MAAFQSGAAVAIPDLRIDDRFPQFGPVAVAAGLSAVFAFPLRHVGGRLGALDLYRETPGVLTDGDMAAAQTLAESPRPITNLLDFFEVFTMTSRFADDSSSSSRFASPCLERRSFRIESVRIPALHIARDLRRRRGDRHSGRGLLRVQPLDLSDRDCSAPAKLRVVLRLSHQETGADMDRRSRKVAARYS